MESMESMERSFADLEQESRKGNQRHWGMKLQMGANDHTGLVHGMETTAANVHDLIALDQLLHGASSGPRLLVF